MLSGTSNYSVSWHAQYLVKSEGAPVPFAQCSGHYMCSIIKWSSTLYIALSYCEILCSTG